MSFIRIYIHQTNQETNVQCTLCIASDVQGFVNPPRVRGRGQEGKGQGQDFMTLNKPLTLLKGQGFSRGFPGGFISLISRYSRCFMPTKLSLNNVESEKKIIQRGLITFATLSIVQNILNPSYFINNLPNTLCTVINILE